MRVAARKALIGLSAVFALGGCAMHAASPGARPVDEDAAAAQFVRGLPLLLPADILLIGEQHDAPAHHALERAAVEALAARSQLAALALEMAEEGRDTAHLPPGATEDQVRSALRWNDRTWPWRDYGPVVMAAVRAGVPVLGANLPRSRMTDAMADVSLDVQLAEGARRAQQDAVRAGHCHLLLETQIAPMTRIQIARDRAMAQAAAQARRPGRTVLLVAGAAHVDKALGVPQHLPVDVTARSIRLAAAAPGGEAPGRYDVEWRTPPLPPKDYCADVRPPG